MNFVADTHTLKLSYCHKRQRLAKSSVYQNALVKIFYKMANEDVNLG
jgi:hypothetical protein